MARERKTGDTDTTESEKQPIDVALLRKPIRGSRKMERFLADNLDQLCKGELVFPTKMSGAAQSDLLHPISFSLLHPQRNISNNDSVVAAVAFRCIHCNQGFDAQAATALRIFHESPYPVAKLMGLEVLRRLTAHGDIKKTNRRTSYMLWNPTSEAFAALASPIEDLVTSSDQNENQTIRTFGFSVALEIAGLLAHQASLPSRGDAYPKIPDLMPLILNSLNRTEGIDEFSAKLVSALGYCHTSGEDLEEGTQQVLDCASERIAACSPGDGLKIIFKFLETEGDNWHYLLDLKLQPPFDIQTILSVCSRADSSSQTEVRKQAISGLIELAEDAEYGSLTSTAQAVIEALATFTVTP